MKEYLKKILGETILGYYDYIRHTEFRTSWGGPFNGQKFRQKIFTDIINTFEIDLIVETGTYRGTTTEYITNLTSSKIVTVESNQRSYSFSKLRFLFNKKVSLYNDDSRKFLNRVLNESNPVKKYIFFYLDAHWESDLPLIEELSIIFKKCERPIIMIDDFQVPGDHGYQYDDYGSGKSLTLELLNQVKDVKIFSFFPSQSSNEETGTKRGCIVLTHSDDVKKHLLKINSLSFSE